MWSRARYRDEHPAIPRAGLARGILVALVAVALPGPAAADTDDLAVCLDAKPTMTGYVAEYAMRGWTPVTEGDAAYERAIRATGEIVGTLRAFPRAFTEARQVRAEVDRIIGIGRRETADAETAFLSRDGLSLMILRREHEGETRLTCYLSATSLPDVVRRLPEPGRNPSGEPLAWNVVSSGPLPTRHIFAEIMYVRLFFQPAQHLLTGGHGVVTQLVFPREATPT